MKKLNYLTAIAIILTASFIGFSSFSTSDTKAVETVVIDGLTYEVAGEYNAEKIVKLYQALTTSRGSSRPIILINEGNNAPVASIPIASSGYQDGVKSNVSRLGNYSTYDKARAICDEWLVQNSRFPNTVHVEEVLALESNLSELDVK